MSETTMRMREAGKRGGAGGGWLMYAAAAVGFSGMGGVCGYEIPLTLDLSEVPASLVQEVIVPIPQEIFASLDGLGPRQWGEQIYRGEVAAHEGRAETALLFGLVVADGFIAVEAEDGEEVKRVGRNVLRLARALGVEDAVVGHANAIMETADAGAWDGARREFDRTRETVVARLEGNRDQDIADLVSLGGWLGGTRVLAAVLLERYRGEDSELLQQAALVAQLEERFGALPARDRRRPALVQVAAALDEVKGIMEEAGEGAFSVAQVKRIHEVAKELSQVLYGEES